MSTRSPRPDPSAPPRRPPSGRSNAGSRRLAMLGAVAGASLLVGIVVGARHEPADRKLAEEWASGWEQRDYATLHALLTPAAQRAWPVVRFQRAYREAATTATITSLHVGDPEIHDGEAVLPTTADTRIFGDVEGDVTLHLAQGPGGEPRVDWRPEVVFPGLRHGEKLTRDTRMPPRATIEARDGTPLAKGEARLSDLGAAAAEVAGRVGPAPPSRAAELASEGVPSGAPVGLTGLELQFDDELAGTPGGKLEAGGRVIASSEPRPGYDVRTTIDPDVQRAAVAALAGRYGGIAAVKPDGEVLALAGIASSAPQPPGSTFKIVTLSAALESGAAKPSTTFPVHTAATLAGVQLQNANGEACGGTLIAAFAESCNSVFAPLGVKIGAKQLVATAEEFGFNHDLGIAGAARATIPAASEIGDDLALGSTAIGQGKVLSTPLHLALVAATIADHGKRPQPTVDRDRVLPRVRAVSRKVARTVARAMRAVVTNGTGVDAAISGVEVAGKTGTAELRSTVSQDPEPDAEPSGQPDTSDTDAWFTGYAPMTHPKLAVCALFVAQGAGGDTAAPAVRQVLEAGL